MRLIDADALIEFIDPGHLRNPNEKCFSELDVVNMLNHAPTVFDVEVTVKKLNEQWEQCFEEYRKKDDVYFLGKMNAYSHAGLIVNRGVKYD